MQQSQSSNISELVHIKHQITQKYLSGLEIRLLGRHISKISNRMASFVQTFRQDDQFAVVTDSSKQHNSLWRIQHVHGEVNRGFKYGDIVKIIHVKTGLLLTSKASKKSQSSKRGLVYLGFEQKEFEGQVFVILQGYDQFIGFKEDNAINMMVGSGQSVMLVCIRDGNAVHSHNVKYLQSDLNEYNEVVGSAENRDNLDLWSIVNESSLGVEMGLLEERRVHHQDCVVIRNYMTGGTIHSHTEYHKDMPQRQEVTWWDNARDSNDWWEIVNVFDEKLNMNRSVEEMRSDIIRNQGSIGLIHRDTRGLLHNFEGLLSGSGKGLELCCVKGIASEQEFRVRLLGLGSDVLRLNGRFVIEHIRTGFVVQARLRMSSVTDWQFELSLVPEMDGYCVWIIEQVDSIFAE